MANIDIRSIISQRDKLPYVQIEITTEEGKAQAQLTPDDAREQALHVLRTADAAESDHFILVFLTEKLDLPIEQCAGILAEFRQYREQREMNPQPTTKIEH